MEQGDIQYLPWQADILRRALALKHQQYLPHAVLIDTTSEQDISSFASYLTRYCCATNPMNCAPVEAARLAE